MSNTTLTNIPSNLDIKIKEPSDGAQVPPPGPGSSDRFSFFSLYKLYLKKNYKYNLNNG